MLTKEKLQHFIFQNFYFSCSRAPAGKNTTLDYTTNLIERYLPYGETPLTFKDHIGFRLAWQDANMVGLEYFIRRYALCSDNAHIQKILQTQNAFGRPVDLSDKEKSYLQALLLANYEKKQLLDALPTLSTQVLQLNKAKNIKI